MKKIQFALFVFAALIFNQASAISADLNDWTAEGGSSTWTVQPGNDSVLQSVNGAPAVFYDMADLATQGTALSGKIEVNNLNDDDFIGFALGISPGEIFSASADYYLVDWKQGTQAGWDAGLAISHVINGSNGNTGGTSGSFWQHTAGEVDLITRANNLGMTGWADGVEYMFNIIFTSMLIEVKVDNVVELSITPADVAGVASFTDGGFGFYNYSIANVLYSSIVATDCTQTPTAPECQTGGTVSEPGMLVLFGLGLAGLGFARRKKA